MFPYFDQLHKLNATRQFQGKKVLLNSTYQLVSVSERPYVPRASDLARRCSVTLAQRDKDEQECRTENGKCYEP